MYSALTRVEWRCCDGREDLSGEVPHEWASHWCTLQRPCISRECGCFTQAKRLQRRAYRLKVGALMGTLTTHYACGHSTGNSIPGGDDQRSSTDMCMDCYRNSKRLLQEGESLSSFLGRKKRPTYAFTSSFSAEAPEEMSDNLRRLLAERE